MPVVLVLVQWLLQLFLRVELSGFAFLSFLCVCCFGISLIFTIVYSLCYTLIFYLFIMKQKCVVDLPGGPLEIEWREDDNHVYMTGPAEAVFYGSVVH